MRRPRSHLMDKLVVTDLDLETRWEFDIMTRILDHLPTKQELSRLALAGIAGLIVWELYAQGLLPAIFDKGLSPVKLILAVFGLSADYATPATILHMLTAVVFYPIGFYVLVRWIFSFGPVTNGLVLGILTWLFAVAILPPIAGAPFFGAFKLWVWKSLVGHVFYGLVVSLVFHHSRREQVAAQ